MMTFRTVDRCILGVIALPILSFAFATEVVRAPIKAKGAGPLFLIHYGQKWGYMHRDGKIAIRPQYDDAGDFFNGRAKVRIARNWGYIDDQGRIVIRCSFNNAGDFSEGLAPTQINRKWGFIDTTGRLVIQPQFQGAAEFRGGLARFEVWDTVRCRDASLSERTSTYTNQTAPLRAFTLHDHPPILTGCYPENERYGFVDPRGNTAVQPRFIHAGDFSEGLAVVREDKALPAKYGYIDMTGRMAIQPQFDEAYAFSEGLAAVEIGFSAQNGRKTSGSWGFINRTGEFAIRPVFQQVRPFSEGLAEASLHSGSWGYVDSSGNFKTQQRYSQTTAFSDGLALVWSGDEESGYYVDKSGTKILEPQLWPQWPFSDGLTVVGQQGKRKYIDPKGTVVAPYEVDPRP